MAQVAFLEHQVALAEDWWEPMAKAVREAEVLVAIRPKVELVEVLTAAHYPRLASLALVAPEAMPRMPAAEAAEVAGLVVAAAVQILTPAAQMAVVVAAVLLLQSQATL